MDFAAPEFEPGAAKADVLVAAVRREVLDQYESTFAVAGLKLERVGLRPYAHKVAVGELLKHALPARVMFASDWPVCTRVASLRQWVAALQEVIRDRPESDRRRLLHDNAERFYGLA